MKILLINNNPVVSRLTALSARKEDIEIDEIQEVTELSSDTYDIVFVDAESWSKDVRDVISENIKMQKSVLFYSDGDEDEKDSFDITILKPFLPSEVSAVIRSVEETLTNTENQEEDNYDILDAGNTLSNDELFDLEPLETKKEEAVASNELSNSLDDDLSFDEKLSEAFPTKNTTLENDDLLDDDKISLTLSDDLIIDEGKQEETTEKKESEELFDLNLNDDLSSLEDDLFADDQKSKKDETPKIEEEKNDSLDDLALDDLVLEPSNNALTESSEDLSNTPLEMDNDDSEEKEQKETQILDEVEIAKIKGILTEDTSDEISLESVMDKPSSALISEEKKETTPKVEIDSDALSKTLTTMPVEALRELLAGAKVHIKIKFPDSQK